MSRIRRLLRPLLLALSAALALACMALPAQAQTGPDAVASAREQLEHDKAAKAQAEEAVKAAAKATELARIQVAQAERARQVAQQGADSYWGLAGLFKSVKDTLTTATSDEATAKADLAAAEAAEAEARANLDQARAAVTQSQQQLRQAEQEAQQAAEQAAQATRDAAAQKAKDDGRWYPTRQEWWRSDPEHAPSWHERGDWQEGGHTYQMHWDPNTGEVYVVDTSDPNGAVEVLGTIKDNDELVAILRDAGKGPSLDWARQQVAAAQADPDGAEARIQADRERQAAEIEADRQARRDRFRVVKLSDLPTTTPDQRAKQDERDLTGVDWKRLGDLTVEAKQDGVDLDDNAALREYGRQHGLSGKNLDEFVYLFSSPIKWTEGGEAVTNGSHRLAELLDAGVEEVLVAVDEEDEQGKEGAPADEEPSPPPADNPGEPKASLLDSALGEEDERIGVGVATGAIGIAPQMLGDGAGGQDEEQNGEQDAEAGTKLNPDQDSPLNPDGVALPETVSRGTGGGGKLDIEALCRQDPSLCLVLDPPAKDQGPPILDIDKQPDDTPGLVLDPPMGNDTPGLELDPPTNKGNDTPGLDEPDVKRPGGRLCVEHPEECDDLPGLEPVDPNINMATDGGTGKDAAKRASGAASAGVGGIDQGVKVPPSIGFQNDGSGILLSAEPPKPATPSLLDTLSGNQVITPVGGSLFAVPSFGDQHAPSGGGTTIDDLFPESDTGAGTNLVDLVGGPVGGAKVIPPPTPEDCAAIC